MALESAKQSSVAGIGTECVLNVIVRAAVIVAPAESVTLSCSVGVPYRYRSMALVTGKAASTVARRDQVRARIQAYL